MKRANDVETSERKSSGLLIFMCLTVIALTLADTWISLNAGAWRMPFWICAGAIGVMIIGSWIKNR
jgi:hypothetical protein